MDKTESKYIKQLFAKIKQTSNLMSEFYVTADCHSNLGITTQFETETMAVLEGQSCSKESCKYLEGISRGFAKVIRDI